MLDIIFNQTFLNNKYSNCYYNIINNALQENRKKISKKDRSFIYYEKHHIIPKSIKPEFKNLITNTWNKVLLTPKEHFICHLLLTKMTTGKDKNKMVYALWGMQNQSNKYQQRFRSNLYSEYKIKMQESLSSHRKGKTFVDLYGEERAAELKKMFKERKTRGPCSELEKQMIGKRFSNSWKTKTEPRGFQIKQTEKKQCPKCSLIVDLGNYSRHHGDNCSRIHKNCPACDTVFTTTRSENKKYCCKECSSKTGIKMHL